MRTSFRSIAPPAASRAPDLLTTAAGIGDRLVREAIWYRGHCNWVGPDAGAKGSPLLHRALGPDLAGGTAGIALFLAQLHVATGDGRARRTALAAIDQALAHTEQARPRGLYAGRLGIAYVAARCGWLLDEERLLRSAVRVARQRLRPGDSGGFDVFSGTAGSIVALVALSRVLADPGCIARAERLGDELADGARRRPEGWSWPAPGGRLLHGLCGIAHGAGGAAWALLELFAVTGETRHRDAAERALDYERHWFDAQEGNWPDLRGVERREPRGAFRPQYASTWCHGAPGIALIRLRAWQILGDERYRADATIALGTTAASVERGLAMPGADFTLGRGLAGNADVLLVGAARPPGHPGIAQRAGAAGGPLSPEHPRIAQRAGAAGGPLLPEHAALAQRAGELGAGRYGASIDGWPCGVPGGLAPALLTGHAGIGLFYLRLHDRAVPSALLADAPPAAP